MILRYSSLIAFVSTTSFVAAFAGCSSPGSTSPATGGSSQGGSTSTGGAKSTGGAAGATSSGGASTSGGTTAAGGAVTSGGATSSGGASSGGATSTGGAGGSTIPATFATVKFVIEQVPCFGAGCHNDDMNPLDMRLDDQLHTHLTTRISLNCGNIPVVNPGKPNESALVKILKGPCGTTPRMPIGCVEDGDSNCVPPDYIAAITQWIASGAPK